MVSTQSKEEKWCLWFSLRENQIESFMSYYFSVFLFLKIVFYSLRQGLPGGVQDSTPGETAGETQAHFHGPCQSAVPHWTHRG